MCVHCGQGAHVSKHDYSKRNCVSCGGGGMRVIIVK